MSDEQKQAQLGKLMMDYKQAETDLGQLTVECHKIGEKLQQLGMALQNHPEGVAMQGMGIPMDFGRRADFSNAELDVAKLQKLTDGCREAITRKGRIEQQLAQLGFPVQKEGFGYRR